MKNPKLGDYLFWKGELAKVVCETREKSVTIEVLSDHKCPHCNGSLGREQIDIIPTSPLFQQNAEAIQGMQDEKIK